MGGDVEMIPLGDLVDPDRGITYGIVQPGKHSPSGTPIVRVTDIRNGKINTENPLRVDPEIAAKYRRTTLRGGELLLTLVGTVGELAIVSSDMAGWNTARAVAVIPVLKDPGSLWVQYALQVGPARDYISSRLNTTVQATLNLRDVSSFPVPMPKEDVRSAINHILGSLDDKIELNHQINRTLEQMAQAIFKSWFIDFDPVVYNAVQAGSPVPERFEQAAVRYRDNPQIQALPRDVLEFFPDRFEDSDLGKIPAGWDVKPIGDVVSCVGGGTPSTKNPSFWEGGTNPFLTPKDMSSLVSPVITGTARHITDAGVEKINSKQIPPGAVMLSSRAPIGYLGINEVPVSINQGIIAMICSGELPNYYVLLWTMANMEIIKGKAGGTTFAEISKKNFRPIQTIIPSPVVLNVFSKHVESLYQKIVDNVLSNQLLGETRDLLLPKLISGELQIPDADKFLEKQQ